jgi:probable F420-dependent oxidoreductase
MKIGIARPLADPGHPIPDVDMGVIGSMAEELGFDWLTYGHHTLRPLNEKVNDGPHRHGLPLYQDPLIGAARALALTKKLEVATGVLVMPMQHPVIVAKQVASLDLYSQGRFVLGLAAGGASASRLELELSGGHFERRWEYTMESIEVMKGLWTQDAFTFDGEFFKFPPVVMGPRPATQPHPRIWLGGAREKILHRVGRHCDGWMPVYFNDRLGLQERRHGLEYLEEARRIMRTAAEEAGRSAREFEIAVFLMPDNEASGDVVRRYRNAGADRLAFSLPHIESVDDARRALETLAAKVL